MDEEILLLKFFEAYKLAPLRTQIELLRVIEESDDPEAQEWLQERTHAVKSTYQEFAGLSAKLEHTIKWVNDHTKICDRLNERVSERRHRCKTDSKICS